MMLSDKQDSEDNRVVETKERRIESGDAKVVNRTKYRQSSTRPMACSNERVEYND